ncbi:hypothetical protein LTR28_006652, partial [Elasticomyces elasticus]
SPEYEAPRAEAGHAPVFMEHFDEDDSPRDRPSAVHAETLANSDFLARLSFADQNEDLSYLPPFGRKSQTVESQSPQEYRQTETMPSNRASKDTVVSALSSVAEYERTSIVSPPSSAGLPRSPTLPVEQPRSPLSSPKVRPLTPSDVEPESRTSRTPRHHASNSSRFSFQMGGADSAAQERLLEERHKLHASFGSDAGVEVGNEEDDDEDFDEDAMYDQDEMEQREGEGSGDDGDVPLTTHRNIAPVPGPLVSQQTENMKMSASQTSRPPLPPRDSSNLSTLPAPSPGVLYNIKGPTPIHSSEDSDAQDNGFTPIEIDDEGSSPTSGSQYSEPTQTDGEDDVPDSRITPGTLGFAGFHRPLAHTGTDRPDSGTLPTVSATGYVLASTGRDYAAPVYDEMYYDDGMIEQVGEDGMSVMDEAAFDDPSFPTRSQKDDRESSPVKEGDGDPPAISPYHESYVRKSILFAGDWLPKPTVAVQPPQEDATPVSPVQTETFRAVDESVTPYTQTSFAYHRALADGLHRAAADGRFLRQYSDATSTSHYTDRRTSEDSGANDLATDRKYSLAESQDSVYSKHTLVDPSGFDFGFDTADETEDEFEDEEIVAAANAEALANDADGFYGQEFGFYSKARGGDADGAEAVNGGYFGAPGIDMLARNRSLKEPNLTPITERSEFSARSSFVAGPLFGAQQHAAVATQPSPGLAQLARMNPYGFPPGYEDDLSHVRRMRNTFGQSNASLQSSNHSPDGFGASPTMMTTTTGAQGGSPSGPFVGRAGGGGGSPMAFQWSTESSNSSSVAGPDPKIGVAVYGRRFDASPAAHPRTDRPAGPYAAAPANLSAPTYNADSETTPRKPSAPAPAQQSPVTAKKQQQQQQQRAPPPPPPDNYSNSNGHNSRKTGAMATAAPGDSVTYVREQDAAGANRWVLERRRTAETGMLELVGREVVEGGRI